MAHIGPSRVHARLILPFRHSNIVERDVKESVVRESDTKIEQKTSEDPINGPATSSGLNVVPASGPGGTSYYKEGNALLCIK